MTRKRLSQAELIDDFKQYVAVVVANTVGSAVQESENSIRNELRNGFDGIAEIFENHQHQLDRHDRDIKKLKLRLKTA